MNIPKALLIIFCVVLPPFLLLFSYQTTLVVTVLTAAQENTLDYLEGKAELTVDYNQREVAHLNDVRRVMLGVKVAVYGIMFILLADILYIYFKYPRLLPKLFWYGGMASVFVALLLLIVILSSFDLTFTLFHRIFFPQGNWQFPADSSLIQTFPLEFFVKRGTVIFLGAFILGLGFIIIPKLLLNNHKQ